MRKKGKKKEEEEKKRNREEKSKYKGAMVNMYTDTSKMEEKMNKYADYISNTWLNAVYKSRDKKTDKWVLNKKGKFKSFNDAVSDCVIDIFSKDSYTRLHDTWMSTMERWRKAEKYSVAKNQNYQVTSLINDYIKNVNNLESQLQSPTGNYEEFVGNISDIQTELNNISSDIYDLFSSMGVVTGW